MTPRLAVVAFYLVGVSYFLAVLGVGGYRAGFLWLVLAIPVVAAGVTWSSLKDFDTNRAVWCVAVALIGITVTAKLVDLAPESTARLDQRLNSLALPFFHTVREERSGHGWCSPHCPRVVRVYRAPSTAPRGAYFTVLLALRQRHLLAASQRIPDVQKANTPVVARTSDVTVTVTASPPTVQIVMESRR